jgi:hypothetical protein
MAWLFEAGGQRSRAAALAAGWSLSPNWMERPRFEELLWRMIWTR